VNTSSNIRHGSSTLCLEKNPDHLHISNSCNNPSSVSTSFGTKNPGQLELFENVSTVRFFWDTV